MEFVKFVMFVLGVTAAGTALLGGAVKLIMVVQSRPREHVA